MWLKLYIEKMIAIIQDQFEYNIANHIIRFLEHPTAHMMKEKLELDRLADEEDFVFGADTETDDEMDRADYEDFFRNEMSSDEEDEDSEAAASRAEYRNFYWNQVLSADHEVARNARELVRARE